VVVLGQWAFYPSSGSGFSANFLDLALLVSNYADTIFVGAGIASHNIGYLSLNIMESNMAFVKITRRDFLEDRQGKTFADVLNDPEQPFDAVIDFFNNQDRQRRMMESEIHHDRAPLAGVVREFEAQPSIDDFLSSKHPHRTKRLRQAVGVVVRMIMDQLGWKKTGKKGSLGVRSNVSSRSAKPGSHHNTGGLAYWFLRAERYESNDGMQFSSVKERVRKLKSRTPRKSPVSK
jgi:hypothetical protein